MKEEFKCKGFFLKQALKKLVIISVVVSVLLFLGLNIDLSYRYFLSMFFVFIGLLVVFYYNRHTPEIIKLQGEKIELTFFNKVFFKKPICVFNKQEIESRIQGENIEIFKSGSLSVRIRRNELNTEEWNKLKEYFSL